MKKHISIILLLTLVFATTFMLYSCLVDKYSVDLDGFFYTEVEDGYMVTGINVKNRTKSTIVIPKEHRSKPVVAISDNAFAAYPLLKYVRIPDTVKSIGNHAFAGCLVLKEIEIPSSVTYIGDEAFLGCVSLEKIEIPDSVEYLGISAFDGCIALSEVNLGNGITSFSDTSSQTRLP